MAQVRIDFNGRRKVQAFSVAYVQAMGDGTQLLLRVSPQVHALGKYWRNSPSYFIGAVLSRAVGGDKDDPVREAFDQSACFAISLCRS